MLSSPPTWAQHHPLHPPPLAHAPGGWRLEQHFHVVVGEEEAVVGNGRENDHREHVRFASHDIVCEKQPNLTCPRRSTLLSVPPIRAQQHPPHPPPLQRPPSRWCLDLEKEIKQRIHLQTARFNIHPGLQNKACCCDIPSSLYFVWSWGSMRPLCCDRRETPTYGYYLGVEV